LLHFKCRNLNCPSVVDNGNMTLNCVLSIHLTRVVTQLAAFSLISVVPSLRFVLLRRPPLLFRRFPSFAAAKSWTLPSGSGFGLEPGLIAQTNDQHYQKRTTSPFTMMLAYFHYDTLKNFLTTKCQIHT
jgi:hypothetical protein